MMIDIQFCHTCGFRYKAQWLADKLTELLPNSQITSSPVSWPLGSFVVSSNDGKVLYEKNKSFHGSNPQPTPEEVQALVMKLAPRGLTEEEILDFDKLHQAQITAGASPPWAVKHFNPRTGSPMRQKEASSGFLGLSWGGLTSKGGAADVQQCNESFCG